MLSSAARARIQDLANRMRMKRNDGETFVLLLGAGASISSGVPLTRDIMAKLIGEFDHESADSSISVEDRFDALWRRSSDHDRALFLKPFLEVAAQPSEGYRRLAELISEGFFDLILTFNFDRLVEQTLEDAHFTDFRVIVRGETIDTEIQKLIAAQPPRVKLLKLHGSLRSTDNLLFDLDEMQRYPDEIENVVRRATERDIITCGYGFGDFCVRRAFAERGESIVCVSPSGVPRNLRPYLRDRRSEDGLIESDFDSFFIELHHQLIDKEEQPPKPVPPNPFKFLESYGKRDAVRFQGRNEEIGKFTKSVDRDPRPRSIVLVGPPKSGKTSLVRAGIMPALDRTRYTSVAIRCQPDLAAHIARELIRQKVVNDNGDEASALSRVGAVAKSPPQTTIIFLDQFERMTSGLQIGTNECKAKLTSIIEPLFAALPAGVVLVFVISDESNLGSVVAEIAGEYDPMAKTLTVPSFDRDAVHTIMTSLVTDGQFDFDPRIIDELVTQYDSARTTVPEKRFTLAHIHAICHILAGSQAVTYETYRRTFDQQNLDALHYAINVCEFMGFAEDHEWPHSVWFRNMVKVPLKESKERIAAFIKVHFAELLPTDGPSADDVTSTKP